MNFLSLFDRSHVAFHLVQSLNIFIVRIAIVNNATTFQLVPLVQEIPACKYATPSLKVIVRRTKQMSKLSRSKSHLPTDPP